jgi:ring-1,2-phenylacetyl-CoA epoxidase subunit PaaE
MSVIFHPLCVRHVLPDTAEAVVVSFDVPEALREVFSFTQGQYLTLRTEIDGQDLRRSYSICAGIDDGELRVGVRKVKGGVFSNWINAHLKPGDVISVMAPQGRFFVPIEPGARRHHLGIAGGSGVTPILSTMKTVLSREPLSRFTLIYGNRALKSTMFKEELEDLKNRYLTRLVLHHVFSDEHTDEIDSPHVASLLPPEGGQAGLGAARRSGLPLNKGVMNRAKIGEFLSSVVPAATIDHAFICGPFQMNDEAEAALLAAGVPEERIHIERFGIAPQGAIQGSSPQGAIQGSSPQAGQVGAVIHEAKPGDAETARITIIRDGLKREISFTKDQPSILDAASAAGLEVPFSCTSGVCGTCRAKLLEGEVRMERNFALDKKEVANGFVLTCQAHPLTPHVVLSFDER